MKNVNKNKSCDLYQIYNKVCRVNSNLMDQNHEITSLASSSSSLASESSKSDRFSIDTNF